MALNLLLDQTGVLVRKMPGFEELRALCGEHFCLGSLGTNYAFSPEPPEPGDDGNTNYMLYGAGDKPLGRGFVLSIDSGFAAFKLISPLPTTGHDLDDAFQMAQLLAGHLGLSAVVTEEGQELSGEALESFRDTRKLDNCLMIKDFADERPGFAVSGVRFPMHMTAEFCAQLAQLDPQAAEKRFSADLAERQKKDYYYMYPNYYRGTESGAPMAIYALNDGVDSIIPREPFIPYGGGPYGDTPVESWQVALIHGDRRGEVLGTLDYSAFLAALRPGETEDYDDAHLLLHGLPLKRLKQLVKNAEK